MREIVYSTQYKKDLKKARKQGKDEAELDNVIRLLIEDTPLPEKYHDHELQGRLKGVRECHVNPGWLLLYAKKDGELQILHLYRLGSHSELLGK